MKIAIDRIDPDPNQPRRHFGGLEEPAESIKANGLIEPITARPAGGDLKRPALTYYLGRMIPRAELDRIIAGQAATMPNPAPPEPSPAEQCDTNTVVPVLVGGLPHPSRGADAPPTQMEMAIGKPDPAPAPTPATPPRIRSSVPPTSIGIDGIALDIANDRGVWYVGIYRGGEKVADDVSGSNPLIAKGTAKRIVDRVKKEFDHLDRKAIQKAVDAFFEAVREADETITTDAVSRVIGAIVRVERETSDPPAYVAYLTGGKCLEFSNRDLAALQPVALNERWQAAYNEPLDATGRDFKDIRDYLLSVAVPVDPPGPVSQWDRTIGKLEARIAPFPLEQDRGGLKRYGICLEPNGILLIRSDLIQDVMVESGQNPNDGSFARYLKRAGILLVESRRYRIPGVKNQVRAWGVTPDIKDEPAEGLNGSLSDDPVGDDS